MLEGVSGVWFLHLKRWRALYRLFQVIQAVIRGPTYKEVCSETTGHYEAVQITFDANKMSYEELLNIYWRQMMTDIGGQFHDRGQSYETVIFIIMKNNIKSRSLKRRT